MSFYILPFEPWPFFSQHVMEGIILPQLQHNKGGGGKKRGEGGNEGETETQTDKTVKLQPLFGPCLGQQLGQSVGSTLSDSLPFFCCLKFL